MNFADIFSDTVDYPDMPTLLEDGMQPGTWYDYVTSTFLNGHLPYLSPVAVYLLQRYRDGRSDSPDDKPITDEEIEGTMKAPHTNFGLFGDDVVFLGETPNFWWLLHLDCDVSDCGIGRVRKNLFGRKAILEAARSYCDDEGRSWTLRAEIPIEWLSGWISFR